METENESTRSRIQEQTETLNGIEASVRQVSRKIVNHT